ncbi:MAG TPA: helix-hairpin-helix domain-containing protein, partial [Planctomycetaceae bacterium]|nr:helix-hairpin-helix domain-containing protein [Planctomycetaceae bacterium]
MSSTVSRRWLQAADRVVCLVLISAASGHLLIGQVRVPPLRLLEEARVSPPPNYQVDINRASWPELTLLPGIGPTLAKRIVAERQR